MPDPSPDFVTLMAAAQAGDRRAYRRLFEAVLPILRRIAARHPALTNPADREDAVQDILLAIHTARASYNPARPFLPWLFAIAHNRIADHARRRIRRGAREVADADHPETFLVAAANTDMSGRHEDGRALEAAIGTLPPGQRMAVRLLKLQEMSLKEASAASGLSVASLKIAVHRAVKSLRKKLVGDA